MQVPDVLQQHRAGDHLPGVANEILEQLELLRQQLEFSPVAARCACEKIDLQVADPQDSFLHDRRATTRQRVDASKKFRQGKRLDQVVVTSRTQAANAVIDLAERADDERGRYDAILSQALDDLESIDARQHAVDRHYDIVDVPAKHQPFVAVGGQINRVAAGPQAFEQLVRCLAVVLD